MIGGGNVVHHIIPCMILGVALLAGDVFMLLFLDDLIVLESFAQFERKIFSRFYRERL